MMSIRRSRPLVDWLHYNGFTMVTKPAKEYTDSMGRRKVKGNMDIELTVDAMELAPRVDHIVLFSGDGDFRPLIASLQRQGVRVSVVSTIRSQTADDLGRAAPSGRQFHRTGRTARRHWPSPARHPRRTAADQLAGLTPSNLCHQPTIEPPNGQPKSQPLS